MTDKTIHNIRLSYDESDERVRAFAQYLKDEVRKEEMLGYYENAKRNPENQLYLNDKFGNELTFVYTSSHNCSLKLRGT